MRWAGVIFICFGVALAWVDQMPALPHGVDLLHVVRDVLFVAAAVPMAFYLFSAWAAWRFFRTSRHRGTAAEDDYLPGVSILKPLGPRPRRL